MYLKSKVVTKRSTLFHGHFSIERLLSFFYLTSITFQDLHIMADDFDNLPHQTKRYVLLKIVEFYHTLFQRKVSCPRKAMHELLLRMVFETLKKINSTSSIRTFVASTFSSRKREKNHQIRIHILVSKCRKTYKGRNLSGGDSKCFIECIL